MSTTKICQNPICDDPVPAYVDDGRYCSFWCAKNHRLTQILVGEHARRMAIVAWLDGDITDAQFEELRQTWD